MREGPIPDSRMRRLLLMFVLALGVHALILLAVRLETPVPRPFHAEDRGIAVTLEPAPPPNPAHGPETVPERAWEPPAVAPLAESEPKVPEKPKKKRKPKELPKPKSESGPATRAPRTAEATGPEGTPEAVPAVTTPARNRKPVYPELARRRGQQGKVLLRAHVDADGTLTDLAIEQSSGFPLLDNAALKAVRRWTFAPAVRAGVSRGGSILIPVSFVLRK